MLSIICTLDQDAKYCYVFCKVEDLVSCRKIRRDTKINYCGPLCMLSLQRLLL